MIREMSLDDLNSVAGLITQLSGRKEGVSTYNKRLNKLDKRNNAFFVAEVEKRIVGWIHVEYRELFEVESRAEIPGLVVDDSMKRKGIGSALLLQAEKWSKERGANLVRLTSNIKRKESHPFYQKLGYKIRKNSNDYRKQLIN